MDARLYWPGLGEVTPDELVLRQLLPMAHEVCGAGAWPTRCATGSSASSRAAPRPGRNGATWQVATVQALQERGMTRPEALAEMLRLVLPAHAQQRARAHLGYDRLGAP